MHLTDEAGYALAEQIIRHGHEYARDAVGYRWGRLQLTLKHYGGEGWWVTITQRGEVLADIQNATLRPTREGWSPDA